MAKYTVELKELLKDPASKAAWDAALSTYPLYTPQSDDPEVRAVIPTREELNAAIYNHYKYYEIGFETPGRYFDEIEIAMNEIMPKYNQLFKTAEIMALIDDPFGNVDVTETYKETHGSTSKTNSTNSNKSNSTNSSKSETESTSDSKTLDSQTPKGNLDKTAADIDSITHADNANWNKTNSNDNSEISGESETIDEGESETNSENAGTVEHTFHKKGNQGVNTYAHDMTELRGTVEDYKIQIVEHEKLRDCHMYVF